MPVRDLNLLIDQLDALVGQGGSLLRSKSTGEFVVDGQRYEIPRYVFSGPLEGQTPIRLGLFAGLHGDEPAGPEAVIDRLIPACATRRPP